MTVEAPAVEEPTIGRTDITLSVLKTWERPYLLAMAMRGGMKPPFNQTREECIRYIARVLGWPTPTFDTGPRPAHH